MGSDESHFNVSVGSDGQWGILYLRAAVHRRGQRPPKGSGTNMTIETT